MLQPARRKFRKEQKGRNTGVATRGANVSFGDFGLKATERGRLTARQIEAARRAISRSESSFAASTSVPTAALRAGTHSMRGNGVLKLGIEFASCGIARRDATIASSSDSTLPIIVV